ncbi:MAG: hypothetical protein ACHQNT_11555 [Bacteroidia bacterium]
MKFKIILSLLVSAFLLSWKNAGTTQPRTVELVFCLDLSASTNGMLHDVRNRMWSIANGILQQNELTDLKMGVVGYGRPSFGSADGYVKVISNLTADFDKINFSLHELSAFLEKGDQFVPDALFETYKKIKWSKEEGTEKMVFLIGNGNPYTGPYNLYDVCEVFSKANIHINTVYVNSGKANADYRASYHKIAEMTNGKFSLIHSASRVEINKNIALAKDLISMSNSINNTFMFYSKDAAERKKILFETDKNNLKMGVEYFRSRLEYKISRHYLQSCVDFDLTAYYMQHNKMPDYINYNALHRSEGTYDYALLEQAAIKKAEQRTQLNNQIHNLFFQVEKDKTVPADSLLDGFVLGSFQ